MAAIAVTEGIVGASARRGVGAMEEAVRYSDFIASKRVSVRPSGFEPGPINPMLFDFQRDIARWAIRLGRAAVFSDCGTGKTPMELVWADQVSSRIGGPVLVFAPLAVAKQTQREGEKFGVSVTVCRKQDDVRAGVNITNYEMLEHFRPDDFCGIVLDESSCLKGHDRATRRMLTEFVQEIDYRLSCTATPAPNDHMELGTQAEWLGVMKRSEMLSMFFIHDGGDTGKWRLKGHGAAKFWEWVASWAVMLRKPSDLGYEDGGFILPPIRRHQHTVAAEWDSSFLFPVEAKTMSERRDARRSSLDQRVNLCAELVNASREQWVVWCDLNAEGDALEREIIGAVQVSGSDSLDHKETTMLDFAAGKVRVIVTKPSIAGFGMNWQNCHNVAFVGLSDSWEQIYQSTRRCWRFGQEFSVDVHVITSEAEGAVVRNIERKEQQAEDMAAGMLEHMKAINTENVHGAQRKRVTYERKSASGQGWELHLADCVDLASEMVPDSVHFQVFSPPFASLYTYSNSERDMGNSRDYEEFFRQYRFLIVQQFRVCMPGRLVSFHCMNIPTTIGHHGYIGLQDFRGDLIRAYQSAGFIFHSEVVIWKDPLIAATRTHALGLSHKELVKDSSRSRQGVPDYLVTVRKPGDNPEPISHLPSGLSRYVGDLGDPRDSKHADPSKNKHAHKIWQRYASPVWFDINPSDTLQFQSARENDDERHICPLQLQVIERAMQLWSNPGDLVFSPFAGIGSEGYVALRCGRRFIGAELKESYWRVACRNLAHAENAQQATFDLN